MPLEPLYRREPHERVRAHQLRVAEARAKYSTLTEREKDVLKGVANGLLNKQIAFECQIGIETVKSYRANALEKLGIRTAVEARDFLILIGVIHLDTLPALNTVDENAPSDEDMRATIRRTLLAGES